MTPGLGSGAAIAAELRQRADRDHLRLLVIVHDLRGAWRNCGCSSGSLGGADHLAGLSQALPGARLVLTGDIAGGDTSISATLAQHGWESQPIDVSRLTTPGTGK